MSKYASLKEFGNRFLGSSGSSIAMLLAQDKVDFNCKEVKEITFAELKSRLSSTAVCVKTAFEQAVTGQVFIFADPHAVAVFANLIMGGDGREGLASHLSDIEFHAFSEVMGQVLAASAASAAQLIGKKLTLSAPEVSQTDLNQLSLPPEYEDKGVLFAYSLVVGDLLNTDFYCLISEKQAQALQNTLSPMEEEKEEKKEDVMSSSSAAAQEPSLADLLGEAVGGDSTGGASSAAVKKEVAVQPVQFSSFEAGGGSGGSSGVPSVMYAPANIELVLDVPLQITVELGRAKKTVKEILDLSTGSIVELDKMDGEPVDVLANGKLFAKGEVVVIGETFGVRVVEIISPQERLTRVRE